MGDGREISIDALLISFQRALRCLQPVADDLNIRWREPDNYDEWDRVARGLFDGFVLGSIQESAEWESFLPLIPYDVRTDSYASHSYLAASWQEQTYPLVCLETESSPFDTCLLADLDASEKLIHYKRAPMNKCRFSVVAKGATSQSSFTSISF